MFRGGVFLADATLNIELYFRVKGFKWKTNLGLDMKVVWRKLSIGNKSARLCLWLCFAFGEKWQAQGTLRRKKSLFTGSDLMKKKVNGTECKTKSSSYTWKALVEMAKGFRFDCCWKKNQNFPFLIFLCAFIFLFPLIVFGFSGEMKVSRFYCCF